MNPTTSAHSKVKTSLELKSDTVSYKRYLTVRSRIVAYPDGRQVDWDIVGHSTPNPAFCTVFPYNSVSRKVTLLVEYCQGPNEMLYNLVSGGFDARKHESYVGVTLELQRLLNVNLAKRRG
jgi:hypothetical protein